MSTKHLPSHLRLIVSIAIGALASFGLALVVPVIIAVLAGIGIIFTVFVISALRSSLPLNAQELQRRVQAETVHPVVEEILVVAVALCGLVTIGWLLHTDTGDTHRAIGALTSLGAVIVSWLMLQTMYANRYAHRFYTADASLDFNSEEPPNFVDFFYFATTIGMTFATSDVNVRSSGFRSLIIRHALLSFLFSTTILGALINLMSSLV